MPNFSAQCVKGVQGIGYLCAFILSLAICVPMSMHQDQFKGRCLLFSTGHWQEQVKRLFLKLQNCQKLIFCSWKRNKCNVYKHWERVSRLSQAHTNPGVGWKFKKLSLTLKLSLTDINPNRNWNNTFSRFFSVCGINSTLLTLFQDGQFKVDWASQAYCNFTIFVAVVMFVISLVQFWRFVKFFRRGRDSRYSIWKVIIYCK